MKIIEVKLDDRVIEVSKLPLKRYAEVFQAIEELPKHVSGLSNKSFDEIIQMLPSLVAHAMPDFIRIISIATGLTQKEIEDEMGLTDLVKVIEGLIEVNDYQALFDTIKKIQARNRKA
jgi:hypothetical protein